MSRERFAQREREVGGGDTLAALVRARLGLPRGATPSGCFAERARPPDARGRTTRIEPRRDELREHRQRHARVAHEREVGGLELLVVGGPAAHEQIRDRQREHPTRPAGRAEGAVQVRDVDGEHEVGVREGLVARPGGIERVRAREVEARAEVHDRRPEELREPHEGRRPLGAAADAVGEDHGSLGRGEPVGRALERPGLRLHGRLPDPALQIRWHAGTRRERVLLERDVEAHVRRRAGLRPYQPVRADERLHGRRDALRLIVPFHEVAHVISLHERGVDPLDPGPPARGVHRAGPAEQQDRHPVAPGVEDGHAGVLEPDDVVEHHDHRPSGRLRVPVRESDRDLLVGAQDRPRSAVVYQGVVQAAEARARVERRVLDPERSEEVDDEIRAERGSGRRPCARHAKTATFFVWV